VRPDVGAESPAGLRGDAQNPGWMSALGRLLHGAVLLLRFARAGADPLSAARLVALRLRRDRARGRVVRVRARQLAGADLFLREGTSDILAFGDDYVGHFNAPPPETGARPVRRILEIGTNIGVGLADFAHAHPDAVIVGVEPDPGNAALARRNTAAWADRVTVVEAAVWDHACELTLEGDVEHGLLARERRPDDPPGAPRIRALAVEAIIAEHVGTDVIDYVFLSAERSEQRILTSNAAWLAQVRTIRVETYVDGDYTPGDTLADLERAGFTARLESDRFGASAVGVRSERLGRPGA
jgi:FkbM family methyltransferase